MEQLGFAALPAEKPDLSSAPVETSEASAGSAEKEEAREKMALDLHKLLLETTVKEGKMVCGNCGHEYKIKEGIANFLLPNHLV